MSKLNESHIFKSVQDYDTFIGGKCLQFSNWK